MRRPVFNKPIRRWLVLLAVGAAGLVMAIIWYVMDQRHNQFENRMCYMMVPTMLEQTKDTQHYPELVDQFRKRGIISDSVYEKIASAERISQG